MDKKTDVLIAEDHPIYRKGLADILVTFPEIGKVHEAANGVEALEYMQKHQPQLVLVDLYMPQMNGFELTATLTRDYPGVKVIILSMNQEETIIREVYDLGVQAFLSKNSDPQEIELAVRMVLSGQVYMSPFHVKALTRPKATITPSVVFDEREKQVLRYMCQSYTTSQIAEELVMSQRTVERLRSSILNKTKAKNVAGVILYASRNGLLDQIE